MADAPGCVNGKDIANGMLSPMHPESYAPAMQLKRRPYVVSECEEHTARWLKERRRKTTSRHAKCPSRLYPTMQLYCQISRHSLLRSPHGVFVGFVAEVLRRDPSRGPRLGKEVSKSLRGNVDHAIEINRIVVITSFGRSNEVVDPALPGLIPKSFRVSKCILE